MRVIVDAWNVLHVTGVLPPGLAGIDLAGLARLMCSSRWAQAQPVLVCDGRAQEVPGVPNAVRVVWSGPGKEADDLIEAHIARASAPRSLTVVSSDRRLQRAARRRSCKHLSSEEFLRSILDDLARSPARSAQERTSPGGSTQSWKDAFDLHSEALGAIEDEVDAIDLPGDPDPAPPVNPEVTPASPAGTGSTDDGSDELPTRIDLPPEVIEQALRIVRGEDPGA